MSQRSQHNLGNISEQNVDIFLTVNLNNTLKFQNAQQNIIMVQTPNFWNYRLIVFSSEHISSGH